jgi:hypothetical protein
MRYALHGEREKLIMSTSILYNLFQRHTTELLFLHKLSCNLLQLNKMITHFVCTKSGVAIYSSASETLSLFSFSVPGLELCKYAEFSEDGSGMPCFSKSTYKYIAPQ